MKKKLLGLTLAALVSATALVGVVSPASAVKLYEHSNYNRDQAGKSTANKMDRSSLGSMNDAASSAKTTKKVRYYEDIDFHGKILQHTGSIVDMRGISGGSHLILSWGDSISSHKTVGD